MEGARAEKAGATVIFDDAKGRLLWDADGSGRGAVESLLTGTGWRVLRVEQGASLARVWPLAAGRDAALAPAR